MIGYGIWPEFCGSFGPQGRGSEAEGPFLAVDETGTGFEAPSFVVGALRIRALPFEVCIRAPDFWKLPFWGW